jgi:hypothetical protein
MKIINDSQYQTKDIRRILIYALKMWWKNSEKEVGFSNKKGLRLLKVNVYNRKNGPCTASYNGFNLDLNLWNRDLKEEINKKRFAWVIRHEIHHLNGLHHKDMIGNYWNNWPKEFTREDWILKFPINEKVIAPKPQVNLQESRYQKAMEYMLRWEKRAKSALKHFKKYQYQVKRYEVIFANKRKESNEK